jgi:SSS family solute:Na+ symporter
MTNDGSTARFTVERCSTRLDRGLRWCMILAASVAAPLAAEGSTSHAPPAARPLLEQQLPDLPAPLTAPVVGRSHGALIVAGGLDADGAPTDRAFVLPPGQDRWQSLSLPQPLADAAFVIVGQRLIVLGGRSPEGVSADVVALEFDGERLAAADLPDLPEATHLAAAVAVGQQVYLIGGVDGDGRPVADDFRRLDLSGGEASAWKTLPSLPGGGLRRPIVGAQSGDVLVVGGQRRSTQGWQDVTDARRYRPQRLDATTRQGWLDMADAPTPQHRPAVFPAGQSHVMVLGARPDPARAEAPVLLYHTITDAWAAHTLWSGDLEAPTGIAWGDSVALIGEGGRGLRATMRHTTQTLHAVDYVVIVLYLCGLIGIGLYFSRRERSTTDFFLGGRKMPWWAVGVSLYATGTSAISFMAIPTKAWTTSTLYGVEGLVGLFGTVAAAYLVIPLVRRLDITSTYEYLERRFNEYLRLWGSFLCIAFQMGGRMSVVLLLPSLAISAVTGLPVIPCIAVMGLLATVYTVLGGISAVIWTDVIQVVVLFGGACLAFVLMVLGSDGGVAGWAAVNMEYGKFRAYDASFDFSQPVIWIALVVAISHVGTATSDQVMVQRVLSTPTIRQARRSYVTLAAIVLPGSLLFTFLGTAMFGYFRHHPEMLSPTMENIHALPLFIVNGLPAGLTGLVIAALFAASMSTLDSSMNSVSTLVVTDFYRRYRPQATDGQCLRLGKWLTAAVGLTGTGAAVLMATFEIKSMFDMWTQLVGLVLGGFGGVFILGMFTRRANGWGALIGAVSSIGITVSVKVFTDLHFLAYAPVAILACVSVGYLASLLLPHRAVDLAGLTLYTARRTDFEG